MTQMVTPSLSSFPFSKRGAKPHREDLERFVCNYLRLDGALLARFLSNQCGELFTSAFLQKWVGFVYFSQTGNGLCNLNKKYPHLDFILTSDCL